MGRVLPWTKWSHMVLARWSMFEKSCSNRSLITGFRGCRVCPGSAIFVFSYHVEHDICLFDLNLSHIRLDTATLFRLGVYWLFLRAKESASNECCWSRIIDAALITSIEDWGPRLIQTQYFFVIVKVLLRARLGSLRLIANLASALRTISTSLLEWERQSWQRIGQIWHAIAENVLLLVSWLLCADA